MKRIALRQANGAGLAGNSAAASRTPGSAGHQLRAVPTCSGPAIAIALVGVDEDGALRSCIYVERIAELRFVGCDPKATAFGRREIAGLSYVLKLQGFRWLECFVPRPLKKLIQKPIAASGLRMCGSRAGPLC